MSPGWLFLAVLSMALYGGWGALGTKAAHLLDPRSVMWFSSLGILIAGFGCLASLHFRVQFSVEGATYSLLTGLANGLGTVCFIAALRTGPMIPVVMITALYPMVTIVLSILFFHQHIDLKQMIGIALSFGAIYCLA